VSSLQGTSLFATGMSKMTNSYGRDGDGEVYFELKVVCKCEIYGEWVLCRSLSYFFGG